MRNRIVEVGKIDGLTGVYSKESFYREARKLIDLNQDIRFAILELDINRLTMINELMGIAEGDKLLGYLGSVLSEIFEHEQNSIYGRIHADLFVVCCPYDEFRMQQYISLIEEAIKEYRISFEILLTFGIYLCEERELNISIMCDRANMALKSVKGNYMQHCAFYDSAMHDKMLQEQKITQTMGKALKNREFIVYYQPKHSLDDEGIIGAEALVRWNSPESGLISPGVFIPVFEENGFIMKLDYYVWEETCKFIRRRLDEGKKVLPVSVNVSRVNIYNPQLCTILDKLVRKYHFSHELLDLEVTESAYTENAQLMIQTIKELQRIGFRMEMDDFGSGYSSLNMLKDVPVDVLKIDLNFLAGKTNSEKGTSIMAAIVRMAKWLGIPAIVEGVETKEQINFLRSIGCTMAQGFFYAKPMPVDQFEAYMDADSHTVLLSKLSEENHTFVDPDQFWAFDTKDFDYHMDMVSACGIYEMEQTQLEMIRMSDSYFDMIHSTREQFYFDGLYLMGWVPQEDRDIVMKMFEDAEKNRQISEGLYRRNCPDGSTIWLHTKVQYLSNDGKRKLFFAMMNDVTKYMDPDTGKMHR